MGTESDKEGEDKIAKLVTTMHGLDSATLVAEYARSNAVRPSLREDLKAEGEPLFMLIAIFLGAAASLAMARMLSLKGLDFSAKNVVLIATVVALAMLHRIYEEMKNTNAPRLVLFSMVFEKGLLWVLIFFPDFSKAISYMRFLASFVKAERGEFEKDIAMQKIDQGLD